jgi:uncharacterized OsmC-like protein
MQSPPQPPIVRSYQTNVYGRCISNVGDHHFVVDHSRAQDGPGDEPGPVEYFLSGITSCGVLMTEREAKARGIPLHWIDVRINAVRRNPATATSPHMTFESATVEFEMRGPTEAQARELVEHYQRT